mmetsp:Transcript_120811/g.235257  ORF Transcript_120811/g.235257 Transcript_120811/m.235257 type:complete len:363 (+) Transcript_120811:51-1139(+)
MAEEEVEDVLAKAGVDLFKELWRIYPVAEVADYYKAGAWRDDVMRVDLQLITAHRKEAGAQEAIPLDEVPEPEIPATPAGILGLRPAALAGLRPAGPAAPMSGPVAELRLMILFVAKWKLDAARTKELLHNLTPARRHWVIQNFKAEATGEEATKALEEFVAESEKTDAWKGATAPTATALPASAPTAAGVKRPLLLAGGAADPSKRPRLLAPAAVPATSLPAAKAAPATTALARMVAARSANGLRPASLRPLVPASARPLVPAFARPLAPASVRPAAARLLALRPVAARPLFQPGSAAPRPPKAASFRAIVPRATAAHAPAAPTRPGPRPLAVRPAAIRPMPASSQEKPAGNLIRNLLSRF